MRHCALILILALLPLTPAAALDLLGPPPTYPETRIVDADGTTLLSKEGQVLAAACVRAVADGAPKEVLSSESAKAALAREKLQSQFIRDRKFPPGPEPGLNVLTQSRAVIQGFRTLVHCLLDKKLLEGAAKDNPRSPLPLEVAIQIYPGADGNVLSLTYLDGDPLPENLAGAQQLRARSLTFELAKKQRVTIERSAPATWTIRRVQNSLLLTARLARDSHNAGSYGSFIFFVGAGHDEDPPEVSPLRLDNRLVPAREAVEGSLRIYACGANPHLSEDVTVVAEVALPAREDGSVPTKNLPCFFYESAEPSDEEGEFRFRFAPPTEGLYGVRVFVTTVASRCSTDSEAIRAGVPASPGFVHARNGDRALRLDDNTIFAPVGCDMSRYGAAASADAFRSRFTELSRIGANTVCLSLSKLMPLEGPQAGHINPSVAALLDEIFRAAQARNIRIVLALEDGADVAKGNAGHPYFREMGGPLPFPAEYFRDAAAKRFYQMRMTYAAARYGAYRSLLAWELMRNIDDAWPRPDNFMPLKNDPEDKSLSPDKVDLSRRARRDVEEWVERMAQQLRGLDQHGHPICVSTALEPAKAWTALQLIENVDWTLSRDFAGGNARSVGERFPGMEIKLTQWAEAARGPARARRAWSIGTFGAKLDGGAVLCAGLASGLASAPLLLCDVGRPLENAEQGLLRGAAAFSAALAEISVYDPKDDLAPVTAAIGAPGPNAAQIVYRASRRGIVAWIHSGAGDTAGAELKLPGVIEGTYTISWMDCATGKFFLNQKHTAPAQQTGKGLLPTILKVPQFAGDAALFLVRKNSN